MIDVFCKCRAPRHVNEADIGQMYACDKCGQRVHLISAEKVPDGAGAGDFDATLAIVAGPEHVGDRVQLGGVTEITVGRSPQRHLCLSNPRVSSAHAKLVRIDFGPSQWKIVDTKSSNGLFVNGQRVAEQELQDGDRIIVGDYELRFGHVAPAPAPAAPVAVPGGSPCPSCERPLAKKAKICVDCGIQVLSGRPVLTRQGVDEDALYAGAESWIRWISLLVWVTPFPIPIRSEAFGTRKPYAIWTIALATILASVTFFIAQKTDTTIGEGQFSQNGINLMLWSPNSATPEAMADAVPDSKIHEVASHMDGRERALLKMRYAQPKETVNDDELVRRLVVADLAERAAGGGEFHWYQLVTHAFLHDTSSVYNFLMHLGGNLVFMLCFGTRVNALIGNLATAILYPILAVAASGIYLLAEGSGIHGPMVGASGAIMGLAGMYLILFPVHQVFCAMWISLWLRFRRLFGCKIFSLRGFWVLLIYFGYDIAMNAINSKLHLHGGVAHWAHIGGFTTGAMLGLGVLLSRLFDTHGGDVLSVAFGRHAWPLIGKPSDRRKRATAAAPQAMPMMPAYG